jgi:DNA-binding NarL/FixJ family response regulator
VSGRIRIVIADDQPLVRAGLKMMLEVEPDIEIAGEAADGDEAIRVVRDLAPDVVLMDVRMPRRDGISATRLLLDGRLSSPPKVLILTTFDLDEYVYEGLRAGASGFVLKDLSPEQLVEAIRVVASGEALLAPTVTRRMIEEYVRHPPAQARQPPRALDDLTPREREMLAYVAKGMSNAEIAAAAFVSEPTVKTHVARILMKLGLRDRVQVVVFAYEHGLTEPGALDPADP